MIRKSYFIIERGVLFLCQDIQKFANIKHKKEKNDSAKGKILL